MKTKACTTAIETLASLGILGGLMAVVGCGANADAASDESASSVAALSDGTFTGTLTVSTSDATVGTPITVTQTAVNLTSAPVGPIIIGIYRAGLRVTGVARPRTGLCRVAGSATCNFVQLAPGETQSYTLTLIPTVPGSVVIRGWTSSAYAAGGSTESVTVTVR